MSVQSMRKHKPDHEIELYRDGDAYTVLVDLPDYEREEIEVHWHDRRLHVSAEHHDADSSRSRVFSRTIGLPHEILDDQITATYEDDLLEVTLPIADGDVKTGLTIEVT